MKLSFIKPRQKGILKRDTRYWLYFIAVSSTAMFGLYGAMEYEIAKIKADTKKKLLKIESFLVPRQFV